MSLSVSFQTPSLFAILVARPPLLRSPTLSVWMVGCLKDTSSGVWTLREFVRFIRSLESRCLTTLQKILFGVPSSIHKDALFHSLAEDCSTVAPSLSASPTSFRTVLRTSSLLEISLLIPGANILLWSGRLAPIILAERTFPLLVRKYSTKDVTMSVFAWSGSNGKESLSSDTWVGFVSIWVMT